ncbi:MAG TPA: CDP-diacylglycerol--serine O-phosphatidyltransferase [Blastocatellia bacterium]|nr:CDP-diacylglycerol--serine O-phosphatidyltransferase [Blastocatellia bacterium]
MADERLDPPTLPPRPPMRRSRKAVFVLPSLLTTANIFCGFYSIMESLRAIGGLGLGAFPGDLWTAGDTAGSSLLVATEHFDRAAITIGFAALFDLLDGRVARLTNTTSEFGIELDSIADVVSFGLAPAVLAFAWGYGQVPDLRNVGWAASFLFLICGALRLARFNVQARQTKPNQPPKNPKVDKKAFVGLPIPFGAAMIASLVHFSPRPLAYVDFVRLPLTNQTLPVNAKVLAILFAALVIGLAFLMVSTLRYSSFKNVGTQNTNPRVLILALALAGLLIWFKSGPTLLIVSTIYVAHGVIGKLWALIRVRRHTPPPELELERKPHP